MCGIVTIVRTDGHDARKTALKRYEAQKSRGQEGYGFVALKDDVMVKWDRSEKEEEIKASLEETPCDILVFHHRMPTSTPNLKECNHPIKVSHASLKYDYYVIHNGVVWESESKRLKDKHEKEGFTYTTEVKFVAQVGGRSIPIQSKWNDSEAMAIELVQDLDKEGQGFNADGSIAFVAVKVDKVTKKAIELYWGTNGSNPLKFFEIKETMITICSEGTGEACKPHTLYSLDMITGSLYEKAYIIGGKKVVTYPEDTIEYTGEMDDTYYDLIEEHDELKRRRGVLEFAGEDTTEIDESMKIIEEDLLEMEGAFDTQDMHLLNG